jgi:TRAP-type C4-dicarboxylate transport system permease small subunit
VDVLLRYMPERWGDVSARIAALFTSSICLFMAYASFRFVQFEYEDGLIAFGSVPAWACEVIIPVAMAVMGVRYAVFVFVAPDEA